ncbi:MAG: hypothetical protein WBD45_04305 [Terriglobales bacterium]
MRRSGNPFLRGQQSRVQIAFDNANAFRPSPKHENANFMAGHLVNLMVAKQVRILI